MITNLAKLVSATVCALEKSDLSSYSLRRYRCAGFEPIVQKHFERGFLRYDSGLADKVVEAALSEYQAGHSSYSTYQHARKAKSLLDDYQKNGCLVRRHLGNTTGRKLTHSYALLLEQFCSDLMATGTVSEGTIKTVKTSARSFLFALEDVRCRSIEKISREIVSECFTRMANKYRGGLKGLLYGTRKFLRYLYSSGKTVEDFSNSLPDVVAHRKSAFEGFSPDEIESVLLQTDRTTEKGCRDYAMILLASQTGLRTCDIANLKLHNIDWRTYEIRIIQQKTSKPLVLPLPIESGNAIAEYILKFRQGHRSAEVFLNLRDKEAPITRQSVGHIIGPYAQSANVIGSAHKRIGFHGFRRAFGKQLLTAETPLDMLNELLGLTDLNTSKTYVAIDEQGLKRCCLGLQHIMEADGST